VVAEANQKLLQDLYDRDLKEASEMKERNINIVIPQAPDISTLHMLVRGQSGGRTFRTEGLTLEGHRDSLFVPSGTTDPIGTSLTGVEIIVVDRNTDVISDRNQISNQNQKISRPLGFVEEAGLAEEGSSHFHHHAKVTTLQKPPLCPWRSPGSIPL